ncbi:neuromedin-B receptor-like [Patiria miniata]|uniref:G-protein coupled receptors family 1 profile domain-containing protein n=1 Tax=Patiria miniata TaxID=46514 RepID=A0A913ZM50_PATMI|nr:neuromedin-B receptor-like [Patiria miniata]
MGDNETLSSYDDWNPPPDFILTPSADPASPRPAIILSIVNVIGFVGNVCMMCVILANRKMRTVPNVLILNLASADLLYILVPTPFYIEKLMWPYWDLPKSVCKLKVYLSFVAQYASVYALAALSWDRHAAVTSSACGARRRETSRLRTSAAVVAIWLASFVLAIPNLVFARVVDVHGLWRCRLSPDDSTTKKANEIARFAVGYVIPLMVVAFYYLRIAVHICRSTQRFPDASDTLAKQMRDRKRLAVFVLIITLFFALCWLPYFSYFMALHFGRASLTYRDAAFIMPVVNTCMDPWLLFAISSNHRACFVGCLGRICCCRMRSSAKNGRARQSSSTRTLATVNLNAGGRKRTSTLTSTIALTRTSAEIGTTSSSPSNLTA